MAREICDKCNRPSATQEDFDDPKHPPGCECAHCASLCWGDNCAAFDWKARVSELEIQVDALVGHLGKACKEGELRSVSEHCTRTHEQYCHICDNAECGDNTNPTIVALCLARSAANALNKKLIRAQELDLAEKEELRNALAEARKLSAQEFVNWWIDNDLKYWSVADDRIQRWRKELAAKAAGEEVGS